MRSGMRALVRRFTEIGIPASRVALELQFQSAPGTGGREGLQPRSKWLEIVKLQALAAQRVTRELRTHSIWSWGWATYSTAGIDPDKGEAVCVYLWVRDQKLCSGPGAAGPSMDASLTVGQLEQLAPGVVCQLPAGQIRESAVAPLARAIGDRDIAESVVLERLVLQQEVKLDAARGARGRARVRRRPLPRQRALVPRRAQADPADADGREGAAARRAAPRGRPGAVPAAGVRARPRSRSSTSRTRGCRRASSRPSGRSSGSASGPAGSPSRRSLRRGSSRCRAAAPCARSTAASR